MARESLRARAKTSIHRFYGRLSRAVRFWGVDWFVDLERAWPRPGGPRLFLDVGANQGQTIREIRAHVPDATIHAFEPVPGTFEILRGNWGGTAGVHIENIALSDHIGEARMTSEPGALVNRIVDEAPRDGEPGVETTCVPTNTLDAWARSVGIAEIDVLKLDCEGHEPAVIRGARELLSSHAVTAIFTEVTFAPNSSTHVDLRSIWGALEPFGYRPFGFYDMKYNQAPTRRFTYCNALFVLSHLFAGRDATQRQGP